MLVIRDKLYSSSDVKFVSIKDAAWFLAFVIAHFGPFFKYHGTHTHTSVKCFLHKQLFNYEVRTIKIF